MDASRLPRVTQEESEIELAARYAPVILADECEPFTLIAAGYTIFEREGQSPSFPARRVEWGRAGYPATRAIEYALWWDWDIGHLYELEHAWTFIDANGAVVAIEASWHGMYGQAEGAALEEADPAIPGVRTHPVLLAQPGKHAMAPSIEPFMEIRQWAEQEAGADAGKDGVLETGLFRGRLPKTPENDARVTAYLKERAFVPAWKFSKRFPLTREILVPWKALEAWIPARVSWWLTRI